MPTFDALAPTYDADFTESPLARLLRGRVHQRLLHHLQADDSVLEFGCGTGEDALYLAQHGLHILATDSSPVMLETAQRKAAGHANITFAKLDLRHLPAPMRDQSGVRFFRLAFANFGPLNVLSDYKPLAAWLAQHLPVGGIAAFAVMSPYCLWETLWHSLHGNFRTASRRWQNGTTFQPTPDAPPLPIYYPSPRRLSQDFAPHFERIHLEGLGLFLPPSDVYSVIEKRPYLYRALTALEIRFAHYSLLAPFADHYWIEFRRR